MSKPPEEWVERYVHEDLSKDEMLALAQALDSDARFREAFVEQLTLEAAIRSAVSGRSWSEGALLAARPKPRVPWGISAMAAAAMIAFMFIGWLVFVQLGQEQDLSRGRALATLSATQDAVWSETLASPAGWLYPGSYRLDSGAASFTFDSGAIASITGPAEFDLQTPFAMGIRRGKAGFYVDESARGFTVTTPHATIEDLGTSFAVVVDDADEGGSDVHVVDGEVAVTSAGNQGAVPYRAREAVRVDAAGAKTAIAYRGEQLTIPAPHVRGPRDVYFHLPLDATGGAPPYRYQSIEGMEYFERDWREALGRDDAPAFIPGRFGQALRVGGEPGRPTFILRRGVSQVSHSICLWVRIPADAPPEESAFLAFRNLYRSGDTLSISWNGDASTGVYGALRVDYGSGFVIGAEPINDGQWRHIVVGVRAGRNSNLATHLLQYVDRRLQSPSAIQDARLMRGEQILQPVQVRGFEFSEYHPFRGAIDELFIAVGLLRPYEISGLYLDNALPLQ